MNQFFPKPYLTNLGLAVLVTMLATVHPGRTETLVAASGTFVAVAREPDGLFRVGSWDFGGFSAPKGAKPGSAWRAISGGSTHALLVDGQGQLFAWGSHSSGELGIGSADVPEGNFLARVGVETDWQSVAAGHRMSAGIKTDGSLFAWGDYPGSESGPNTSDIPLRVGGENDWKSVASGYLHRLALKTDGSLWAWGYNSHYSLGDGTNLTRLVPVRIGTDTDWASVACVGYVSFGIKTDGSLWGWGTVGTLAAPPAPAMPGRIGTATDWKEIAPNVNGGHYHAIKTDGTLWSWGTNTKGQLGHGDTVPRNMPAQVGSSNGWAKVAAAASHVVAVKTDGTIWHWGGQFSWPCEIPSSTFPLDQTARYAPVPEILLQKELTPGGSVYNTWISPFDEYTFPISIVGEPAPKVLTIHNDGLLPLVVSAIELPEGFSCTNVPGPILPFSHVEVVLSPANDSAAEFSGTIRIVSNDPESPAFEFFLQATVVSPSMDTDGDGMKDDAEVKLSSLGFDWQSFQPTLVADFYTKARQAGFITPQDVKEVVLAPPMLRLAPNGGDLSLELEFQDNLDSSVLELDTTSIDQLLESPGLLHLPVPSGQGYLRVLTR